MGDTFIDEWEPMCECCGDVVALDELRECGCGSEVCSRCTNRDGDDVVPDTCGLCRPTYGQGGPLVYPQRIDWPQGTDLGGTPTDGQGGEG